MRLAALLIPDIRLTGAVRTLPTVATVAGA